MDINKYRTAYWSQKARSKVRGIEFQLTFQQWCAFWGEDIERRGNGPDNLQMQRFRDTGPYAVGNICKGTPKQNSATYQNMRRMRHCEAAAHDVQVALDAAMNGDSLPEPDDDGLEAHYFNMGIKSSYRARYKVSMCDQ